MNSDPKEPKIPSFMSAFSGAVLSAPRNPLALLFAFASVCFGTEAFQLFREDMPLGHYAETVSEALSVNPFLVFLVIPGYLASAFFRTALLFALSGISDTKPRAGRILRRSVRILPRILLLETGLFLSLLFLAAILLSPSLLAGAAPVADTLRLSGIFLFLSIGIVLLFTAAYSTLFIAFSDIPLSSAVGLGYELLRKRTGESLLFGILLTLFAIAVSLLVFGISATITATSNGTGPGAALASGVILLLLTLHTAIRKRAWILFFLDIARPKDGKDSRETSQNGEKVIQRKVPETGQASAAE